MGLFDDSTSPAARSPPSACAWTSSAENLANANTTRGADGGPYRRKTVVLQQQAHTAALRHRALPARWAAAPAAGGGVQVAGIVEDTTPNRRVYDPGHPDADAQGYVTMPNVDSVTEMVDLITASRAYEANVTAMQAAKTMFTKTLELLR